MIITDNNGRIRNIPNKFIISHILNLIPQGIWFQIFISIFLFVAGYLLGLSL